MADSLRFYDVVIQGRKPGLLMSNGQMADPENFFYKRIADLRQKGAAGEEVERQRVKYHITGRLYVDGKERIVIPAEMLSSTLKKGSSSVDVKRGRKWWSGITVMDDAPLQVEGLPKWDELHEHSEFVHRCMARDANGGPQPRYRPIFREWSATIPVEIDTDMLDKNTLETVFKATGRAIGLGDWRPSSPKNPGKYGRFSVERITEIEQP